MGKPDLRLQERSLNSIHHILVILCLPIETVQKVKSLTGFIKVKRIKWISELTTLWQKFLKPHIAMVSVCYAIQGMMQFPLSFLLSCNFFFLFIFIFSLFVSKLTNQTQCDTYKWAFFRLTAHGLISHIHLIGIFLWYYDISASLYSELAIFLSSEINAPLAHSTQWNHSRSSHVSKDCYKSSYPTDELNQWTSTIDPNNA